MGRAHWRTRLPADRDARGGRVKGRLAARSSGDRRAYTAAKAAFLQRLLSAPS